jgi:alcohol dehydrogenase class IV
MQRIARALGGSNAAQAVYDLAQKQGAVMALRDLGMKEADLDRACDIALKNQYPNPRPLQEDALRQLFRQAWEGNRPN